MAATSRMLAYAEYRALGGLLDEGTFEASVSAATAVVDSMIGYKAVPTEHLDAYHRAVAIAVDGRDSASGSVTIGSFSMSGASDADVSRDVRAALFGTGLLYAGVHVG